MAVNRIDFPNAPSGSVDAAQRTQLGIGYSGIAITGPSAIVGAVTFAGVTSSTGRLANVSVQE